MAKERNDKKRMKNKKKFSKWIQWVGILSLIFLGWGAWQLYSNYQHDLLLAESAKTGIYRGPSGNHRVMLDQSPYQFRETRKVIDPMRFSNQRQISSYIAAKKYPQILDQLYCYCRCKENWGHKSLLTCYADDHASKCGICIDEALMAAKMTENGEPVTKIADAIDSKYQWL